MKTSLLIVAGVIAISAAFTRGDGVPDPNRAEDSSRTEAVTEADDTVFYAGRPWERPEGPVRVALQAGHWKSAEAPAEQAGLRNNGTRGGGKQEWEVNLAIAKRTAELLEAAGYVVDILPTTIPPGYWADLFLAIHADGSTSSSTSGYRAAAPRRDRTGQASRFVELLEKSYGEATGLPRYPTVTRRMRGYYAFNSRRYEHALHPMAVGAILETGFLTSPRDRSVIVEAQERVAKGIAEAITLFLETSRAVPDVAGAPPPALTAPSPPRLSNISLQPSDPVAADLPSESPQLD
ncbi:MAG: hypothetical protein GEU90_11695 [Gemmatimonas sp.]|nr:hypothetical protein [Gemmatimonas sp.]